MSINIEELNKLPPAERLAKIKELQESLKKEETQAKKIEEDSKKQLERDKKQLDELLRQRMEEDRMRAQKEKETSKLEQTIQKTPEAEKKPEQIAVNYGTGPEVADSHYERRQPKDTAELLNKKIKPDSLYDKDTLYKK